jgi:hypothetical protein
MSIPTGRASDSPARYFRIARYRAALWAGLTGGPRKAIVGHHRRGVTCGGDTGV